MQSVGNGTSTPPAVQMQSMPAAVTSTHDDGRQKSDVDSHVAMSAFVTVALLKPLQF